LFKIDGKPADKVLTPTQKKIFKELIKRKNKRLQIESSTQYGKSLTVALACIVISCIQKEIVAVVAPNLEKAKIIMRYYIEHLGDSLLFYSQLEAGTRLERLRKEESKERIMLRNGGGIYVLSTNERNVLKSFESAMGFGANCIPAGYKISTDIGDIEISKIYKEKNDCKVLTYNHNTKRLEYKKILNYQKRKAECLIEIDLGYKKIIATEGHPFYVEGRGYIKAKDIKVGDTLWDLRSLPRQN
jgi:hypothetical protein